DQNSLKSVTEKFINEAFLLIYNLNISDTVIQSSINDLTSILFSNKKIPAYYATVTFEVNNYIYVHLLHLTKETR
ncbi:MAG TPA: hypothetical protein VIU35_03185, partial [Chitinophagaceae bacterium]